MLYSIFALREISKERKGRRKKIFFNEIIITIILFRGLSSLLEIFGHNMHFSPEKTIMYSTPVGSAL